MHVAGLWRYPIKSCRGIGIAEARVGRRGIEDDRRWIVVDPDGGFVTQREEPRLALVAVALGDDRMRLTAPGIDAIDVPSRIDRGEHIGVTIWTDSSGALVHDGASRWMSRHLARDVRVAYMSDDERRAVDPRYAAARDIVSFADGYPLLVASRSSLEDLEARIGAPVAMERFRPNVVVEGAPPWDEDAWIAIAIGGRRFRAPKPCDRCVVTTIDQETAIAGKEPLRTLATFRKRDGKVYFGVNLIPVDDDCVIRVGDRCDVERS